MARFIWKRPVGDIVIGALSAGQVNSNNIGIPLSLYLLGSAAYPAPVILMQLLVFATAALNWPRAFDALGQRFHVVAMDQRGPCRCCSRPPRAVAHPVR